jgi:effector-binding domain-containing protein
MAYTCELVDLRAQPALVVRTRTSVERLPEVLGPAWGAIMAIAGKAGAQPTDPPFVAYHNTDMQDLDVEIGMSFAQVVPGEGDVQAGGIAARRAVECVHVGPYAELHAAYRALEAWMAQHGLQPDGPAYEFYLNDPGETAATELRTRVVMPVR